MYVAKRLCLYGQVQAKQPELGADFVVAEEPRVLLEKRNDLQSRSKGCSPEQWHKPFQAPPPESNAKPLSMWSRSS